MLKIEKGGKKKSGMDFGSHPQVKNMAKTYTVGSKW
jgi:hypothetical protein